MRGRGSARAVLPPGRGRGSSVSSIVCYLTGLSHIDPVEADLFSGRFLNDEGVTVPDIDLDFPRDIREVLIPRVHEVYGADRSALVAAFPTYRPRGVVRDLGKALGLPPEEIEKVAKTVGFHESRRRDRARRRRRDRPRAGARRRAGRRCSGSASDAMGLPRHASQHSGGMVISTRAADRRLPGRAGGDGGAPDRPVGQGLLRRRAACSRSTCWGWGCSPRSSAASTKSRRRGGSRSTSRGSRSTTPRPSNRSAPPRPPASSRSRAGRRCRCCRGPGPQNLDDLTVQVALVRPGPIQGGAVHPYIERRKRQRLRREGRELRDPLRAPVAGGSCWRRRWGRSSTRSRCSRWRWRFAGFSRRRGRGAAAGDEPQALPGGDREAPPRLHRRRRAGTGVPAELAERIWDQIQGFSGFGFPKAHSAAFGLLAYQSAWLRVHRGPEFLCALLNEQPMGFYPPDCAGPGGQRREIRIAPPDANRSRVLCHVETRINSRELVVRIGLGYVKGVRRGGDGGAGGRARTRRGLSRHRRPRLAFGCRGCRPGTAGLGRGAGRDPRRARASGARHSGASGSAPTGAAAADAPSWRCRSSRPRRRQLEPLGEWGRADRRLPLDRDRPRQAPAGADAPRPRPEAPAQRRTDAGRRRQHGRGRRHGRRPPAPETAKGIVFMLLEDERGIVNVIVPTRVYERHRAAVRDRRPGPRPRPPRAPRRRRQRPRRQVEPLERQLEATGPAAPLRRRTARPRSARQAQPRAGRRRAARRRPGRPQLRPAGPLSAAILAR